MDKNMLLSKTFYLGIIVAITPLFPSIHEWVAGNSEIVGGILGAVIVLLRRFTSGKVKILPVK